MSLLKAAQSLKVVGTATGGPAVPNRALAIDIADLPKFAAAVEKQFPTAVLNEGAIKGGGLAPDGESKMVPFAVIQRKPAPHGTATVYYNGKVNLAGVMTTLQWPVRETRSLKPQTDETTAAQPA